MKSCILAALLFLSHLATARDDFPIVPDDIAVDLFAKEPLVRNPCAITFDAKGRLCVGMGPQYRRPRPDTPGDSVWILLDDDRDGVADGRREFATGFNSIQGLAWRDGDLWVANAPDLTIVRDLDGDDVADEYLRLFTDLGNLEHGLHGLNFGPDGKLYMSKGNSKGLTQPGRAAPKPFRRLWGVDLELKTTPPRKSGPEDYQKAFHDPNDDWGRTGGILRCDPDGSNLEIVAEGCRNPWDICFDDGFNWLGTDNDQTLGDKIFAPFYGAHFGWGHAWSFDWEGLDHLPTVPASGPLFEGSGAGVIFSGLQDYPEKYRGVFFVNDWLKRKVYIYRPTWHGAWLKPDHTDFEILAEAGSGRSMQGSSGRAFDPVDIEIGPDGAIWISSWGRAYGVTMQNGRMTNEGRIYRIRPKSFQPKMPQRPETATLDSLIADLGSHLPVWRSNAQAKLIRRGAEAEDALKAALTNPPNRTAETWMLWTLGAVAEFAKNSDLTQGSLNRRIQTLRILAHRRDKLPDTVGELLHNPEPRIRHETVLALWQCQDKRWNSELIDLAAEEKDRIVFYSTWRALQNLMPVNDRKALLRDKRSGVRLAALLSLLEEDALSDDETGELASDADARVSSLVEKRLGGKDAAIIRGAKLPVKKNKPSTPTLSVVTDLESTSGNPWEEATLNTGTQVYTDRSFRAKQIPNEFHGATFLRAANHDADPQTGTGVTFKLRFPSTIFLADDVRGKQLPAWARGKFETTDLKMETSDSKFRIYRAEFPAGEINFGPNREDVTARKGQYIVIIRPTLLSSPDKPTTAADVTPLLANADPQRGRTLYLSQSGATCASCHRLEGVGNVFAPDLSDLATRSDADYIIRSILEPSAEITEGFAMQTVTTTDGDSYGGVVLEETGRTLKFGMMGGATATVETAKIARRETMEISAMPAVFAAMLNPQDVADITAYLLAQKPKKLSTGRGFHVTRSENELVIHLNGQAIANYIFKHKRTKRPFFAHLKTPTGIPVTRNFPPKPGDSKDHAFMHPGLWLGFANLNGESFWHNNSGTVVHQGFVVEPKAAIESASFAVKNHYIDKAGLLACQELATYQLSTNKDGYLITIDSRFSGDRSFSFGVKEEMGLGVRMATPLIVKKQSGSILNAEGGRNEPGTWGKVSRWWDYFGTNNDRAVGIQIMSGTGNPDVWSHSRDYGVLVANPFPVDRKPNRHLTRKVNPEEEFRLRFGVQIHDHPQREQFDPKKSYQRYVSGN